MVELQVVQYGPTTTECIITVNEDYIRASIIANTKISLKYIDLSINYVYWKWKNIDYR